MLIATTIKSQHERANVLALYRRFGQKLRVLSLSTVDGIPSEQMWLVKDMNSRDAQWTRRILKFFLDTSEDASLVKIEPDSAISQRGELSPDRKVDVAGDFRRSPLGMVFLGGFQYYTRKACRVLLDDKQFDGPCLYQDIELASSISRNKLVAYNMASINVFSSPGDKGDYVVTRLGDGTLKRLPSGRVIL